MKMDYVDFQERGTPLGCLITIRCYGTWLHGDERGSVNRRSFNRYGTPKINSSANLEGSDRGLLAAPPFRFDSAEMRSQVDEAILEVCTIREVGMPAINVRTNHGHIVVTAGRTPERLMTEFKAYSTRRLREKGLIGSDTRVWSRHGSTRYLWTDEHIASAVSYVLYDQGDTLKNFD